MELGAGRANVHKQLDNGINGNVRKATAGTKAVSLNQHPDDLYTAENRILKAQIKGRLLLSEADKATLAEIAHRLGREALEEVAATAKPDTILGWYRKP
jgi:hypothetical protein